MRRQFYGLAVLGSVCLTSLVPAGLHAQQDATQDRSAYWGDSDAYLHKQAFEMFELVDEALTANPPVAGAPLVRKLALYNLDALLHETRYDNSEPFNRFLLSRMKKVSGDLHEPVKKGMKLYKIYNDGFIARTRSVTLAFDVVRGVCNGKTLIPDSVIRPIVEQCDILFITHKHGDHADPVVAGMFLEAGKPVVAPTDVWENNKDIRHLRSDKVIEEQIDLGGNKKIRVKIFPGHQSELMNNLYVVTTGEGKTVAHIGDQYNKKDLEWIATIGQTIPRPDALIVNCWTYRMNDLVKGFNPKRVFTGHENEMGHTIDHREAFWLTFRKMEEIDVEYVVMGWGEWFRCP